MDKILIVEDETLVALDIALSVETLGFIVTNTVTNHNDALQSVKENTPDIILVDITLQNSLDGIQTATDIKKDYPNIGIVYLTAFCDDDTLLKASKTQPLGYITKPFKQSELKSTLTLARYKLKDFKTDLGYGYFFDKKENQLYKNSELIRLSYNELKLFNILYDNIGKIVSFEQIEHFVWEDDIVSSSTLRTLLYRVRVKLDTNMIETIPKIGCRLNMKEIK